MFPGVDIIEIERFARAIERHPKLKERLFTYEEQQFLAKKSMESWAARFAGKEAILKAFGTGLRGLSWHDIEILSDENGEPVVHLSMKAKAIARNRGGSSVRISLSHDRTQAIAMAILI